MDLIELPEPHGSCRFMAQMPPRLPRPARPSSERGLAVVLLAALLTGCWRSHGPASPSPDGGTPLDAGDDARRLDAASDAPADAPGDALADGGPRDATPDAPVDASPPPPTPPPLPERCRVEPVIHPFDDPVLEFRWPAGPVARSDAIHVCTTPAVADLDTADGLGDPRIVFISYPALRGSVEPGGALRIVTPGSGETITYPSDDTEESPLAPTGHVALADLDGDGRIEIVAVGRGSGTYAFRNDGTPWWSSPYPLVRDIGSVSGRTRAVGPAPTIADLEGDGAPEVIVGRVVLDGQSGALRWRGEGETGRAINFFLGPIACAADLDGDGRQEVIVGSTVFRSDGAIAWNRYPDVPDGLCAVADVLADPPGPEVVLTGNGYLFVLAGDDGRVLWERRLVGRVRQAIGGAPTVADFDGDGRVELGVAHGGAYGVYDPACRGSDDPPGCQEAGLLWMTSTSDASSAGTGSSVFDFNGDGRAEVVYNDEHNFQIFAGPDGAPLFRRRNSSRTRTENPTIVDVDNDGDAEIVFGANAEAFFVRRWWTEPGLEVWGDARGRWVGARRIWNQHAYHITNIEEDGSLPQPETPSWTVLNAYRQNLREDGDVLAAPDLWGGRGQVRCAPDGSVTLRVEVANWGLERAGAGIVVGFYEGRPSAGGRRVGEARTGRPLEPSGDAVEVTFRLDRPSDTVVYWALLDDPADGEGGVVAECLEDNNEVWIGPVDCSRP